MKLREKNKTCLSYWFPIIQEAGLPVPKTAIVNAPDLSPWLRRKRGESLTAGLDGFFSDLAAAIAQVGGFPVFLRTGFGSGKHEWADTCFVPNFDSLPAHVYSLFEWSHLVDFMGLPTDVWVARELLHTDPAFHAFAGMPVTKERRYFVHDGEVVCHHPYWPEAAFESTGAKPSASDWKDRLAALNEESLAEVVELSALSRKVSEHVPGFWSVDWLHTKDRGWVLIDMAEGQRSFHWDGCQVLRPGLSVHRKDGLSCRYRVKKVDGDRVLLSEVTDGMPGGMWVSLKTFHREWQRA